MRVVIIGPGRVGQALARRWQSAGLAVLGFLGRSPQSAQAAVAFVGAGRVLSDMTEIPAADVLLLSVGDQQCAAVAQQLAASLRAEQLPQLCLHASGYHGLEVLAPLAARAVPVGSLHPLSPFADAVSGHARMQGQPAVLQGDAKVLLELRQLATAAGMQPVVMQAGDRPLYHAACVLAANGLTALNHMVSELFALTCEEPQARQLTAALMQAALDSCRQQGAVQALSGPAVRGDSEIMAEHQRLLQQQDPALAQAYAVLMQRALQMAQTKQKSPPHQPQPHKPQPHKPQPHKPQSEEQA